MKKSTIAIFIVFALIFAVAIPYIAIRGEGEADSAPVAIDEVDEDDKELFATNCGSCHTLARAGTDGVVGPNLDKLLGSTDTGDPDAVQATSDRVLAAIEDGVGGRMPAGILAGQQAEQVAEFVAENAGQ